MCFITGDINLEYLAKVYLSGFSKVKLPFFFLSILRLREREISAVISQLSHGKLGEF